MKVAGLFMALTTGFCPPALRNGLIKKKGALPNGSAPINNTKMKITNCVLSQKGHDHYRTITT